MRLSVDKSDPGYCPFGFGSKVFLDGTEISYVITADEERRMIIALALDEHGQPRLTPDREDIVRETRYGDVRLELCPAMNRMLNGR